MSEKTGGGTSLSVELHESFLFRFSRWQRLLMWFGLLRDPRRRIHTWREAHWTEGGAIVPKALVEEFERRLEQEFIFGRGAL